MSILDSKVIEIENSVEQLITKTVSLSDIVKNQESKIELLSKEIKKLTSNNKELEDINDALSLRLKSTESQSESKMQGFDNTTYNHQINELVKEINACISLLNK